MRIAPNVMIQELAGESVILDLKSERYLGLDEVGTRMWRVLLESPSIQAAHEILLAEYEVTQEQLESDLSGFVDRLLEMGLIVTDVDR